MTAIEDTSAAQATESRLAGFVVVGLIVLGYAAGIFALFIPMINYIWW